MSTYWQGYAPNYSRKVEAAYQAVRKAEDCLGEVLRSEYPLNSLVRVTHNRGGKGFFFFGTVDGWCRHGARISVLNHNSGKSNKWWAAHVELVEATQPAASSRGDGGGE